MIFSFYLSLFPEYTFISSFPSLLSRSLPLQGQIGAGDRVVQKCGGRKGRTWLTLLCSDFILSTSDFLLGAFSWVLWRPRAGVLMPFMPSTRWILHHGAFNLILTTAIKCPQFSFSFWIGSKTATLTTLSYVLATHGLLWADLCPPTPFILFIYF